MTGGLRETGALDLAGRYMLGGALHVLLWIVILFTAPLVWPL